MEIDLKGKSVVLGMPTYDGKVVAKFASSLADTVALLPKYGVSVYEAWQLGSCYIDKARDVIIHKFLHETDATHLLFIDADMSWDAESVLNLLAHDKGFVCGMYCGKQNPPTFMLRMPWPPEYEGGLIKAEAVPTGFLMMSRDALERMEQHYKELRYHDKKLKRVITALCHMYIENGSYFREDIALCRRWAALGEFCYIDPTIKLKHWNGVQYFDHQFQDYLNERLNNG